MKIENFDQAKEYLESFIKSYERITPRDVKEYDPLNRMRRLLELLGNPQNQFKSVLIGGTSGKGSTAYLISHILTQSGYKTGLTISPHLQKVNERIQINGIQISDKEFVQLISSIVRTIELMKKEEQEPSYFEILIAMVFVYFTQKKVDLAVVEVGMGGLYDATNTLNPLISIITNVSLDHTNILGKTIAQIAREKAGIIKKYQVDSIKHQVLDKENKGIHNTVISGVKQKSVIRMVEERCKEMNSKLFLLGKDFDFEIKSETEEGEVFDFLSEGTKIPEIHLSMRGFYQVENAALAVEVVFKLQEFGFNLNEKVIRKALSLSNFPGRFEVIHRKTQNRAQKNTEEKFGVVPCSVRCGSVLVLDGAHNPTKMRAFIRSLKNLFVLPSKKTFPVAHNLGTLCRTKQNNTPNNAEIQSSGGRFIFVVAFKKDKNIKGMLKEILKVANIIILTEFHSITDASLKANMDVSSIKYQVLSIIKNSKVKTQKSKFRSIKIYSVKNSKKAILKALEIADKDKDLIVVTGSLYLIGEIRNVISNPHFVFGNLQKEV